MIAWERGNIGNWPQYQSIRCSLGVPEWERADEVDRRRSSLIVSVPGADEGEGMVAAGDAVDVGVDRGDDRRAQHDREVGGCDVEGRESIRSCPAVNAASVS